MNKLKFAAKLCVLSSMCSCHSCDPNSKHGSKIEEKNEEIPLEGRNWRMARMFTWTVIFEDKEDTYYKNLNETDKRYVFKKIFYFLRETKNCKIACKAFTVNAPSFSFEKLDKKNQKTIILNFRNFLDQERGDENIIKFLEKYTDNYLFEKLAILSSNEGK